MFQLSPVLVDVCAVVGFVVLAALGKISPELASGTVLAVLAGRMRPVTGRDGSSSGGASGAKKPVDAAPDSGDDPTLHHDATEIPSGVLTLINAPRAALAALRNN